MAIIPFKDAEANCDKSSVSLPGKLSPILRLATGEHIRRFETPDSNLFIIFPYELADGKAMVITPEDFASKHSIAFQYLEKFANDLRKRDMGSLDKPTWYEYSRTQNLSKQQQSKLLIAGTAPELRVSLDADGHVAANDKRVYTVNSDNLDELKFLLGILNSKVIDFIFRRIARPKVGGFFDIEKQFIAPLPIPDATNNQKTDIAAQAEALQRLTTKRRDLAARIAKRAASLKKKKRHVQWLFPDLPSLGDLEGAAPQGSDTREKRAWAKAKLTEAATEKYEEITRILDPTVSMSAKFNDNELFFFIDQTPVISGIWLDDNEGSFIAAQWANFAAVFNITEKTDGKKICEALSQIGETDNAALRGQIINLQDELTKLDTNITTKEQELDEEIFGLYELNEEEIDLIQKDRL
jgi:hypothetical protein